MTVVKPEKPPAVCFCKSFAPGLLLCKLFGFLPIRSTHENGICVFKKSTNWLIYSGFIIFLYMLQVVFVTDILNILHITEGKSLHLLLGNINDIIYSNYIVLLCFFNCIQYNQFSRTLNKISPIMKAGLYCESSKKMMINIQYGYIILMACIFVLQYVTIACIHYSESYHSNFDIKIIVNRFMQNIPFIFYVQFAITCTLFISCLVCFERMTINALKFIPVHPMKGIDETSNERDFLGMVRFKMCKDQHIVPLYLTKMGAPELVEYLRILHEEVCVIMYEMNNCMNPQILIHMVVELTVLIIHWYAVIIYMAFDFVAELASTLHVLNCFFVFFHTFGLFIFLRNAQHLRNIVLSLSNYLLEYSTRISSTEEHQQVRIFIEKLKLHRPLTASGVFNLDLGIAGPICANILTYVLVALQFEVPKT